MSDPSPRVSSSCLGVRQLTDIQEDGLSRPQEGWPTDDTRTRQDPPLTDHRAHQFGPHDPTLSGSWPIGPGPRASVAPGRSIFLFVPLYNGFPSILPSVKSQKSFNRGGIKKWDLQGGRMGRHNLTDQLFKISRLCQECQGFSQLYFGG